MIEIFQVGGCVRDELLGIKSKDIDFSFVLADCDVTIAEGFQTMKSWLEERKFQIFLCTEDCLTIRAKFPKGDPNEGLVADFVLARKEDGYIEGTRKPFVKPGSIEDDLIRRDFTVNAIAKTMDGTIIDLFGGQEDLKNEILRTPTDPIITLMDDPLRILRCWRFSITKGFAIDLKIWDAMRQPGILKKLETTVSGERIREELFKMFKHDTVKSLELLTIVEADIPGMMSLLFKNGLHLEPTFKQ